MHHESQEGVQLLRDFDDRLFTTHPSEHLRNEDARLQKLAVDTEKWRAAASRMN
jgi:hypothetical protein